MSPIAALIVLVALVAAAALIGVLLRASSGRVRGSAGRVRTADGAVAPADLGGALLGSRATLVQFSAPTCAVCPSTARLLGGLAAERPGVAHVEVDLAEHPAVADRFGVLQTPTVLLLDAGRRIRGRIGGAPRRESLVRQLDLVLGGLNAR